MTVLSRQNQAALAHLAKPGEAPFTVLGLGVAPGRAVIDQVSGQMATVVGGGVQTVHLTNE